MILRICFSVVDSKANVFAPSALPRGPHLGPPPLDITDRDRALRERRQLAAKLEAAQREERRRIARDIMTSWCNFWQLWPSTSAVSLLIRLTRHEAPVDKRERFRPGCASCRDGSEHLSPIVSVGIGPLGISRGASRSLRRLRSTGKYDRRLHRTRSADEASNEIGFCLNRVIQEGLRNAVKHAQTRRARIALACKGSVLRLSVKDAGVGFTPSSSKRMAGLGLESMRERVQVLGGTFSVQSQLDGGTEINVEVSLPKT